MAMAAKRLQKEAVALTKEPPPHIRAKPQETDILTFHYVIEGPKDSPYEGGFYHGVLKFPSEYPLKPPAVMMYTPNGRFQTHTRLCLSMSDYHPETWNPVWSVSTILTGLLSFMLESADTLGSIKTSYETKRKFAAESLDNNLQNKEFCKLFPELVELAEQHRREQAVAAAQNKATGSTAASAGSSTAVRGAAAPYGAPDSLWQSIAVLVIIVAVFVAWLRSRKDGQQHS